MAQVTGFSCDICGAFFPGIKEGTGADSRTVAPKGWLQIRVNTPQDRHNLVDICGSECLATFAENRWDADEAHGGAPFVQAMHRRYMSRYRRKKGETGGEPG